MSFIHFIVQTIKKFIRLNYTSLRMLSKVFIVLLLLPLAYNYMPMKLGEKTFYLSGSSTNEIIDTLHEYGYGVSFIDKFMLRFIKLPSTGWYTVTQKSSQRFNFFESLEKQHSETFKIKIYAGENSMELSTRLANDLNLRETRLFKAYQKRSKFTEADIFSGYYSIARKAKEGAVMDALFHRSHEKLQVFQKTYSDITSNALEHKILLTIASIIQKESNHVKEMPLISSVIYNRLEKDMKLQMDGTLNYGKYSRTIVSSKRIKVDTSDYNTYKNKGLPPTPLCSISIEALEAAYLPESSNYLFFMLNKNGTHNFSVTYKEHLKNIRKFKSKPKKK